MVHTQDKRYLTSSGAQNFYRHASLESGISCQLDTTTKKAGLDLMMPYRKSCLPTMSPRNNPAQVEPTEYANRTKLLRPSYYFTDIDILNNTGSQMLSRSLRNMLNIKTHLYPASIPPCNNVRNPLTPSFKSPQDQTRHQSTNFRTQQSLKLRCTMHPRALCTTIRPSQLFRRVKLIPNKQLRLLWRINNHNSPQSPKYKILLVNSF